MALAKSLEIIRRPVDLLVDFARAARAEFGVPSETADPETDFVRSLRVEAMKARRKYDAKARLGRLTRLARLRGPAISAVQDLQQRALPTADSAHPELTKTLREAEAATVALLELLPSDPTAADPDPVEVAAAAQLGLDVAAMLYEQIAALEVGSSADKAGTIEQPAEPQADPREPSTLDRRFQRPPGDLDPVGARILEVFEAADRLREITRAGATASSRDTSLQFRARVLPVTAMTRSATFWMAGTSQLSPGDSRAA